MIRTEHYFKKYLLFKPLILTSVIINIFVSEIKAQNNFDLQLIIDQKFENNIYSQTRQITFGISDSKSKIIKYNPVTITFSGLLYIYQKWLSPQISAECLFYPSCSEYSKLLYKRYGIIIGSFASADRLMRCDRISATTINAISVDDKDGKIYELPERYSFKEK